MPLQGNLVEYVQLSMDTSSSFLKPESPTDSPFDVQSFKNLLDTLKQSKRKQELKTKPVPSTEE